MNLTEEQQIIVEALKRGDNTMVKAYAGCAKTTTIEAASKAMKHQPTLAVAFNVKIKKELERRLPAHFEVKTLNGLGHSAWSKTIGRRLTLDEKKLGKLITQLAKDMRLDLTTEQWIAARQLVTGAMQAGLVPSKYPHQGLTTDTPENWADIADRLYLDVAPMMLDFARSALIQSIKLGFDGTISFDDQIYLSTMFNGVFQPYQAVLVDEAQDLSPLNHIQIKRSAGTTGQLGVVGDPLQAIYAFRGADSQSMGKLQDLRKDWTILPLTLTFRCPKVVVGRQQAHAPGFRAWHTNPEGQFLSYRNRDMDAPWQWSEIVALQATPASPIAIICRNNAPLLSMAFKLIRAGVGCTMLGRDLGKNLIALSKKLLPLDDLPADACVKLINEWAERETQLALANDKEEKLAGITDRQECLIAVIESAGVRNAGELRAALDSLFSREYGLVTLATGHKAKGLEWDIVIHLDPFRVPSKYARSMAEDGNPAPLQQEMNLKYVIETRAKHVLVEANGEDFQP